ncbi:MAG: hypothetical protein KGI38_11640 [Thaumarchaeota archaeon]|nr:hypothetical protein [Nitrososphaerota archaeon]
MGLIRINILLGLLRLQIRASEMCGRNPMKANERAVWEDAEGSLRVPKTVSEARSPLLRTSQMEKGILWDYQLGAFRDGVKCSVYVRNAHKSSKTPRAYTFYETTIQGIAHIALELKLTAPYRRSVKFASEINRFKAFLALPREKIHESLINARSLSVFF